jgi:hypothetical protein
MAECRVQEPRLMLHSVMQNDHISLFGCPQSYVAELMLAGSLLLIYCHHHQCIWIRATH